MDNLPERLLVVGDAHCRFDPVFGQGVSVAAMEAHQLQLLLQGRKQLDKAFTQQFYKKGSYYNRNPLGYDNNRNITSPGATDSINSQNKNFSYGIQNKYIDYPQIILMFIFG